MRLAISFLTKPGFYFSGAKCGWARCGGERSPSLSRPTSASPGPHFLGQVCITKRFPRPCSELERKWVLLKRPRCDIDGEKVVWELEKSPDTISTSTKRHAPPSERLSPRCTRPGEDVRRRRDERRLRRERRGRREWRRACLRVCCVCCVCVP